MNSKALTNKDLMNLTEYQDYDLKVLDSGETVRIRKPVKYTVHNFAGDDIAVFTDNDGLAWFVEYHDGEPYKKRAIF